MTEERKATNESGGVTSGNYRRAFFLTLVALIAVIAVAGWLWWRSPFDPLRRAQQAVTTASNEPSQMPEQEAAATDLGAATSETALAPIQLSPQRMQSIGVRIGTVQAKTINDEIRSYGNVQPDERRFAYVQAHFAGWIRQVYADATGDFVRKGHPLFTIYRPDLIASEREYLVAKKNAVALQNSSVSGVADGAASLIAAAKARLQQFDIADSEIAKLD